jgi:pimeloyl-ACP methyl ester carboxylesterase
MIPPSFVHLCVSKNGGAKMAGYDYSGNRFGMNLRAVIGLALTRSVAALTALAALCLPGPAHSADLHGFGIVYLHGKGGWPGALNGGILSSLQDEGALVATPEMPWSFNRIYGATYEQAMAEIDAAVAGLKAQGARRIVVIGHSLGANAAIGYAARHPDLAGVVALAPGHLPEADGLRSYTESAIAEAKQLVATGQGDVPRHFPDMAQGIPLITTATPIVYLSMFDPDGPAVIPKNTAAMAPIPFLWVVGMLDPIDRRGPEYAFNAGAKNPKSKYIEIFAGHLTTPLAARKQVVEWINSL